MNLNPTTILFEIVNFLVLLWVLQRLLYRPLEEAIAAREKGIADQRQSAQVAHERALALQSEWDDKHRQLGQEHDQARSEALEGVALERERILEQAREDSRGERKRAQAMLEAERTAAESWLRELAIERSTELAAALLMKLAPQAVDMASLAGLVQSVDLGAERLRDEWERNRSTQGDAPQVEIRAARMPSDSELTDLRSAFERALGTRPSLSLVEDPSLLGGYRVAFGGQVVDASIEGKMRGLRDLAEHALEESAGA